MTGSLDFQFEKASARPPETAKPNLKPVSLRLNAEERARLERDAGNLSLSAYMRKRLFGKDAPKARTSGKSPVKDQEAMARVLDLLGRSEVAKSLRTIAEAIELGGVPVDGELEADLKRAAAAIAEMRYLLITALGLGRGK